MTEENKERSLWTVHFTDGEANSLKVGDRFTTVFEYPSGEKIWWRVIEILPDGPIRCQVTEAPK